MLKFFQIFFGLICGIPAVMMLLALFYVLFSGLVGGIMGLFN